MRKGILKTVLCTALSVVMAAGVSVGAAPKQDTVLKAAGQKSSIRSVDQKVIEKKVTSKKTARIINNDTNKEWTPQIDCDLKTDKIVGQNRSDENLTNWIASGIDGNNAMVVHIKMPKAGSLYLDYISVNEDAVGQYADIALYKGKTISGQPLLQRTAYQGRLVYDNAARGSYTMVIKCGAGKTGYGFVYPYYVTSEDIKLSTSFKLIAGTGKKVYETFSIKSRRQVWIDSDKAKTGYIEQKIKNKWTRVTDNNYFYTSKTGYFVKSYYALNTGTYRFVMQPSKGTLVNVRYGSKTCSTKYATKQSKAKEIKYKKKAENLLTSNDKKGTTHYYKFYVNKTKKINIVLNAYQTAGKMKVTVYGKNLKTNSLTMSSNAKNKGFTGKLRKGTYYIKISKTTTTTGGKYSIQYK